MKVLVLGGDGMLGHQLVRTLSPSFTVRSTIRDHRPVLAAADLLTAGNTYTGIDVRSLDALTAVMDDFRPEVAVNAVGIVKQRPTAEAAVPSIEINALFPHRLQQVAAERGVRVIHLSTDCVFSGRKGNYVETDFPDAEDLYGRSKLLGELVAGNALTLRTSMIGRELKRKMSLLEWLLAQKGTVSGYRKAVFSGLTTPELARVIHRIIAQFPDATGLYHLAARPIDKYDLLCRIKAQLGLTVNIAPDDRVAIDRSLDGTRFRKDFGYEAPSWDDMIAALTPDG
ncbi:MAG: SDR family oxidoreductase [Pseudomonadota bacterium]